jgi:hypothetical protein
MKAVLLIFVALLTCGFIIETPESRREAARAEKRWKKEVKAKFDFPALRQFLVKTVAETKQFEGIDLTAARLEPKWKFAGSSLTCGDWLFTFGGKDENFEFAYTYADQKFVALKCVREKKDSFRLLQVYKDEWIILEAMKEPNQSLEPTPTSVTIPADAGLAPAAVVAHL